VGQQLHQERREPRVRHSTANWLVNQSVLLNGIPPRALKTYKITMTQKQLPVQWRCWPECRRRATVSLLVWWRRDIDYQFQMTNDESRSAPVRAWPNSATGMKWKNMDFGRLLVLFASSFCLSGACRGMVTPVTPLG
jgi:hypothetical protein